MTTRKIWRMRGLAAAPQVKAALIVIVITFGISIWLVDVMALRILLVALALGVIGLLALARGRRERRRLGERTMKVRSKLKAGSTSDGTGRTR